MPRMHALLLTLLFAVTPAELQAASLDRAQLGGHAIRSSHKPYG